jgi:hypothetical protein
MIILIEILQEEVAESGKCKPSRADIQRIKTLQY